MRAVPAFTPREVVTDLPTPEELVSLYPEHLLYRDAVQHLPDTAPLDPSKNVVVAANTRGSYCPTCDQITEDDASCNCRECGNPRGETNE